MGRRPVESGFTPLYEDTVISRRHILPIMLLLMLSMSMVLTTGWLSSGKYNDEGWRDYYRGQSGGGGGKISSDARKWCDLNGIDHVPSGVHEWQTRLPSFLILGDGKDVATELVKSQHPFIVPPPNSLELNSMYSIPMDDKHGNNNNKLRSWMPHPRVNVRQARHFLWHYAGYAMDHVYRNERLHSFESSPRYLLDSVDLMPRLFCVCPWVKLVVILRHPIDRLWHHYHEYQTTNEGGGGGGGAGNNNNNNNNDPGLLESMLDREMNLLQPFLKSTPDTPAEEQAWKTYLDTMQRTNTPALLGGGLYDVQLRYLFRAMKSFGLDPHRHLLVLRYDQVLPTTTTASPPWTEDPPQAETTTTTGQQQQQPPPSESTNTAQLDPILNFLFGPSTTATKNKNNDPYKTTVLSKSQSAVTLPDVPPPPTLTTTGDVVTITTDTDTTATTNNNNDVETNVTTVVATTVTTPATTTTSSSSDKDQYNHHHHHRRGRAVSLTMKDSTRHMLETFYESHNQRLFRMLGQDQWRDPWPPSDRARKLSTPNDAAKVYTSLLGGPV